MRWPLITFFQCTYFLFESVGRYTGLVSERDSSPEVCVVLASSVAFHQDREFPPEDINRLAL